MTSSLSRREFLKFAGLVSLGYAMPQYFAAPNAETVDATNANVLIVVFDAWTASQISLYGYHRKTTPNLEKLAEKAIVYHNHFAGGHYTVPGTTSLLTGTLPWTHRVFHHNAIMDPEVVQKNIFRAFNQHHRLAYSHNPLADLLLRQFMTDIENYQPWQAHYFETDPFNFVLFQHDPDVASLSWRRALKPLDEGHAYTLYLSQLYAHFKSRQNDEVTAQFPRGVPNYHQLGYNYYTLEQGINGLGAAVSAAPRPFLGYYHFLPPHDPYFTHSHYYDHFAGDGILPPNKPIHFFEQSVPEPRMIDRHRWYDEFILYVDAEFARLYEHLEQRGLLENTWLVLTSDHGEMFERGIMGHVPPVFYQPISHIPLMIFPPGQTERVDITDRSSAIDLLPTLLSVTGQAIPTWAEGEVLPPFAAATPQDPRDFTNVQVQEVDQNGKISEATAVLVRGNYKLQWYFGYKELEGSAEHIELFDSLSDPEELHNLYPSRKALAEEMLGVLKTKIDALSATYSS